MKKFQEASCAYCQYWDRNGTTEKQEFPWGEKYGLCVLLVNQEEPQLYGAMIHGEYYGDPIYMITRETFICAAYQENKE